MQISVKLEVRGGACRTSCHALFRALGNRVAAQASTQDAPNGRALASSRFLLVCGLFQRLLPMFRLISCKFSTRTLPGLAALRLAALRASHPSRWSQSPPRWA